MDIKAFMRAEFAPRESEVRIPELAAFFPEGSEPVFRVRGLSGPELAQVNEEGSKDFESLVQGLLSQDVADTVQALKRKYGVDGKLTPDFKKRLKMLELGSVEPRLDWQACIKLAQVLPVDFYNLTQIVTKLTGAGHVPGKVQPSGKTSPSEQASPSVISGGDSSTR
ncbi:hypothetical protein PCS_02626 [Desulfocurvibacter africanus PCS]|uniref:Uncharacterized protein n=1 Tax=Desulfocurvibacter africanus PCS TaxID=1262666 RepID=M5PR59_DESAF|nr:hypothetical protein [Desulfocurvibacter africanus]EMG36614.1 hypothetical protein PCS_02626 [Desulfocurvibacter africanus PCS]